MEVALLLGLAAVGYALVPHVANAEAQEEVASRNPKETFTSPRQQMPTDNVVLVEDKQGHNNMVPFFGSHVTQSIYSGATDGVLDTYTGSGRHTFKHKEEQEAMFQPEAGTGFPFGRPVETDFEQSRMVTSLAMKNVFPIERVQVGPGVNDGYTNLPSGGYQQDAMREFALPRTTDELRTANKPKLTYEGQMIPGSHYITNMGIQAPVKKNRPDRFQVLQAEDGSMPYLTTTNGQQMAGAIYPDTMMKEQQRETTSREVAGPAQAAAGGFLSYVRAFTEPFQEFMKLTVEGRPTPAGPVGGTSGLGPSRVNVQTHRDESLLQNARGFEAPLMSFGGQAPTAAQIGSVKHVVGLQEDIHVARNDPGLLSAFESNPFTHSLQSTL